MLERKMRPDHLSSNHEREFPTRYQTGVPVPFVSTASFFWTNEHIIGNVLMRRNIGFVSSAFRVRGELKHRGLRQGGSPEAITLPCLLTVFCV